MQLLGRRMYKTDADDREGEEGKEEPPSLSGENVWWVGEWERE